MRLRLAATALCLLPLAGLAGCGDDTPTPSTPTGPATPAALDAAYCAALDTGGVPSSGPSPDAAATKAKLEKAKDALAKQLAAAPAPIKADVQTISDALNPYFAAAAKANYDLSKVPPDVTARAQAQPVRDAQARIQDYAFRHCPH